MHSRVNFFCIRKCRSVRENQFKQSVKRPLVISSFIPSFDCVPAQYSIFPTSLVSITRSSSDLLIPASADSRKLTYKDDNTCWVLRHIVLFSTAPVPVDFHQSYVSHAFTVICLQPSVSVSVMSACPKPSPFVRNIICLPTIQRFVVNR